MGSVGVLRSSLPRTTLTPTAPRSGSALAGRIRLRRGRGSLRGWGSATKQFGLREVCQGSKSNLTCCQLPPCHPFLTMVMGIFLCLFGKIDGLKVRLLGNVRYFNKGCQHTTDQFAQFWPQENPDSVLTVLCNILRKILFAQRRTAFAC